MLKTARALLPIQCAHTEAEKEIFKAKNSGWFIYLRTGYTRNPRRAAPKAQEERTLEGKTNGPGFNVCPPLTKPCGLQ